MRMSEDSSKDKPVDPEMLRHFMLGGTDNKDAQRISKKPDASVDLHLDETAKGFARLADGEKLREQLKELEQHINNAIANGCHKTTVIHGKGEGKLKAAVAAFLKEHPAVKSFRPLPGGGSTEVKF